MFCDGRMEARLMDVCQVLADENAELQTKETRVFKHELEVAREMRRYRDALEKIAGGIVRGTSFETYIDAMIEIAKQALEGSGD